MKLLLLISKAVLIVASVVFGGAVFLMCLFGLPVIFFAIATWLGCDAVVASCLALVVMCAWAVFLPSFLD